VAVAVAVLNATLLPQLAPLLVAPLAIGAVAAWLSVRRGISGGTPPEAPSNPLQLGAALQMAAAFQIVLFLLDVVNRWFGGAGLLASALRAGAQRRRCPDGLDDATRGRWPGRSVGGRRHRGGHSVELHHQAGHRAGSRSRAFPAVDSDRPAGDDVGGTGLSRRRVRVFARKFRFHVILTSNAWPQRRTVSVGGTSSLSHAG
jgi:hypothetical protein